MNRLSLLLAFCSVLTLTLVGFSSAAPETTADARPVGYQIDLAHSSVYFKVRHLGIANVTGEFTSFAANLSMEPGDLSTLKTSSRIDAASVDTGNETRDADLRSENFFDVNQHPYIRFSSTGVTDVEGDTFKIAGELKIHGVTKPVVLDAELLGTAQGPGGQERIGIVAETTIDRRDFGLTWNNLTEAGGIIVGHDVKLIIEVEAVRPGV